MQTQLNWSLTSPGALSLTVLTLAFLIFPILASPAVATQAEIISAIIAPIPNVKPFDEPEAYGPDTLWEKINGQAEFYLPAGFEHLKSQLFVATDNADMFIEVNIYDMGNLANAFSVFSLQKRDNASPIDVTPMAYQTENAAYFVHGPYYVEIISMMPLGARMTMLSQLARQFVKDTPVQSADMQELTLFPKAYQIRGSLAMIPKDAFGFDGLDQVFTVAYRLDQDEVIAFISKRKSPADAAKLVNDLYTYFKDFGANDIKMTTPIKGARLIEIMGTYEYMFSINNYFAGVHEAPSQEQAEKLAQILAESLKSN
ncbi:MAG: hypothetical protein KJO34_07435 [Deltaproteobacteria bacterium]|nr:hypothetical protein [Deltaproteobacteria bacterium]